MPSEPLVIQRRQRSRGIVYHGEYMLGKVVSSGQVGDLVAQARRSPERWLLFDPRDFRAGYNERPFLVRHRLAEHPLFEFRALAALCRRLPPSRCRTGSGSFRRTPTSIRRFSGFAEGCINTTEDPTPAVPAHRRTRGHDRGAW